MKILFLPTVQHTGTWFMIEYLSKYPGVDHFVELQVLRKNPTFVKDVVSGQNGLLPNKVNLVQGHFMHDFMPMILSLAATCPTVIPLRDPLMSVITAVNRARNPGGTYFHVIDQWVRLATTVDLYREAYNPLYIPLDLLTKSTEGVQRWSQLDEIAEHMGLPSATEYVKGFADAWPHDKHNSRGRYPLKEAYEQGEKKILEHSFQQEWQALSNAEPFLRPMLEREGYKDLMWWS